MSEILIAYRENDSDSELLADYYLGKYDLDGSCKVSVPCSLSEILPDYSTFQSEVENPIKDALTEETSIIILGMNVPGGFYDGQDIIASTSRISRIRHTYGKKTLNPLYDRKELESYNEEALNIAIICSRIDGPTLEYAEAIIDSGENLKNQVYMNGAFVLDPYSDIESVQGQEYRDELLYAFNNVLRRTNVRLVSTILTDPYFDPVIPYLQHDSMYWGWFADRSTASFFRNTDTARVFFYNADYDGAFTIRDSNEEMWCGLALRGGYSNCAGALSNPTIDGFLRPTPFMESLLKGFSIGEAFVLSSPYLDWTISFFGDPLNTVNFRYPATKTDPKHEIWHDSTWDLAKAMARYSLKEEEAYEVVRTVSNSQDVRIKVDLLIPSYAVYDNIRDGQWNSTFSALASDVLMLPVTNYWGDNLRNYLNNNNFKISQLFIDVIDTLQVDLSSDYIYDKGYWEHKSVIINESNRYSLYHFEIQVSEDINFSNIVTSAASKSSVSGWLYEREPNEYVEIPSGGVPSSYIDRHVLYQSQSVNFLDRGKEYYFRIRQIDQYSTYDWSVSQDTIGT